MSQFENFTDGELINELESRGYVTNLLFSREDVQMQLDSLNEDREEEGKEPIELDDDDKDYILETINLDWYIERMNETIFEKVSDYFDEEDEIEDEIED
jgi:cell division protein FtsB